MYKDSASKYRAFPFSHSTVIIYITLLTEKMPTKGTQRGNAPMFFEWNVGANISWFLQTNIEAVVLNVNI
jgi:hypothetical protein